LATAEDSTTAQGRDPTIYYTRLMIARIEDCVVPAGSGGRRWFLLRPAPNTAGHAYFAAIDEEMETVALRANTLSSGELSRSATPVTPWLIEQRLHSQDPRKVWCVAFWLKVASHRG